MSTVPVSFNRQASPCADLSCALRPPPQRPLRPGGGRRRRSRLLPLFVPSPPLASGGIERRVGSAACCEPGRPRILCIAIATLCQRRAASGYRWQRVHNRLLVAESWADSQRARSIRCRRGAQRLALEVTGAASAQPVLTRLLTTGTIDMRRMCELVFAKWGLSLD